MDPFVLLISQIYNEINGHANNFLKFREVYLLLEVSQGTVSHYILKKIHTGGDGLITKKAFQLWVLFCFV